MAASITAKLGLDASGFTAGLTRAQAALGKLGAGGTIALGAAFAAAAAAAGTLAVGIKKAIDVGGALSELSARTGVAAGELRVLQMAFDRAGVGAEKVGPAINKMQRAIVEAGNGSKEAQDALGKLGLSVSELSGMSPDQQFAAISQAIGGMTDPAQQAAAAMAIFGRSGGEMLALFKDSGALGDAARAIGLQADLLTKNANLFDRASDILNTVGAKLEGFFVGVADAVVPAIMPLLEAADGLDFASLGQSLGQAIAFGITVITSGQLGNLLTAQFKLSGAELINTLVKGVYGMTAFIAQRFVDIPSEFVTLLGIVTKAEFWAGVGNGLLAAAMKFAAVIQRAAAALLEAVSKVPGLGGAAGLAAGYRESAAQMDAGAAERGAAASDLLSGPLAQVRERIATSFDNAINAAAAAMETAGETIDTSELEAARDGIVNTVSEQMKANEAAVRSKFSKTKTQLPSMDEEGGAGKTLTADGPLQSSQGIIAQSLQAVGGGGVFTRFSDRVKKLNEQRADTSKPGITTLSDPTSPQTSFPNISTTGDTAAQHLREAQKQTGLLSRILEKIAPPTQMTLMPA